MSTSRSVRPKLVIIETTDGWFHAGRWVPHLRRYVPLCDTAVLPIGLWSTTTNAARAHTTCFTCRGAL